MTTVPTLAAPPASPARPTEPRRSRTPIVGALVAVAGLAVVALVLAASGGDRPARRAAASSMPVAGSGQDGSAGAGRDQAPVASAPVADSGGGTANPPPLAGEKLFRASVSDTANLSDGQAVSVHVEAAPGSQMFGFEAFLCGDGSFAFDADVRPTQTGECVASPLSAVSDDYEQVRAAPPYASADAAFRVGVGTNTYRTQSGAPVTITCGPGHPCRLVLKVQYPDGYGFAAYPLTYR